MQSPDASHKASCAEHMSSGGKDLWFDVKDSKPAKLICSVCPVREWCLDLATNMFPLPSHGLWAGYSAEQIHAIACRPRGNWRNGHATSYDPYGLGIHG
jgi:hypothetical protein